MRRAGRRGTWLAPPRFVNIPPQITFRDIEPTDAIRNAVEAKTAELEQFCDDIMHCRVVIEAPHRRHRKGTLYRVRIDLTVPGEQLVIGRHPAEHAAHHDVLVAVRDAFQAAQRRLDRWREGRAAGKIRPWREASTG